MEILLHQTTKIVELNGVPARIAVAKMDDQRQFEAELETTAPPSVDVAAIPLRLLI